MEIQRAVRDRVITAIISLSFIKVLTQSFEAEDAFIRSGVCKISLPCGKPCHVDLAICLQKFSCMNCSQWKHELQWGST